MRPHALITALSLAASISAASSANAASTPATNTAAQRRSLSITVYSNYAMVRDTRWVDLASGKTTVAFEDVSPQINEQFAFLTADVAQHPVWVDSQYYDAGGYTSGALMKEAVGGPVLVITTDPKTGAESYHQATLFSTDGPTLIFPNRVEVGIPPNSRLAYLSIPSKLRAKPSFITELGTTASGRPALTLNYITDGLSWTTDYVAILNVAEDSLNVDAVASIANNTGVDFENGTLQLVGGSPQRLQVAQSAGYAPKVLGMISTNAAMMNPNNAASREALLEYYLYTVPHPVTLGSGQIRTMSIFAAESIPTTERYEVAGQEGGNITGGAPDEIKDDVEAYLQFVNQGKGLGIPLPAGNFHVFKPDSSGNHQFVGEDQIAATPKNATVRLDVGKAFDITAKEVQTAYREADTTDQSKRSYSDFFTSYRVTFANAKSRAVTVHLTETLGGNWQITRENFSHATQTSGNVSWDIPVPANGSQALEYSVYVRQPQ